MRNPRYKTYVQPAFLICVAVLAAAAGGMRMTVSYLGVQLRKLPLPLKKPLDLMNEAALYPYKVIDKARIENPDELEGLGTDEYIQWTLQDTKADPRSSLRYCLLFVTYYTGNPDQVPHVPEECYFGGGHQRFATKDVIIETGGSHIDAGDTEGDEDTSPPRRAKRTSLSSRPHKPATKRWIPVRCLVFGRKMADIWERTVQFPVFYFFNVNGEYAGNRDQTRRVMSKNLFGKYSYYSKVEWRFFNSTSGGATIAPTQAEAITASSRLLDVVLDVLEREHWPDWEEATKTKNEKP